MDNGCVILFVHFTGFFPVSSPLLEILLERITLGYFGAPPPLRKVMILQPFPLYPWTFLYFSPPFLTFIPRTVLLSPAVARLPDLIGTIPPTPISLPNRGTVEEPEFLQRGDGHMEVAPVFVDVLQGFETFVHKTEILQRR